MKKKIIPILTVLLSAVSCTHYAHEYIDLEVRESEYCPTLISRVDTMDIDASATSLRGTWSIRGGHLFFTDHSVVGIREFDADGRFVAKHINKGRGPGESISPFNVSCFDSLGNVLVLNHNWQYLVFDPSLSTVKSTYVFLSDENYKYDNWVSLLQKPDPEKNAMYEFNLQSRCMVADGQDIIVPIETEHVLLNAYIKFNSKRYWHDTYNFMRINPYEGRIKEKFGHFPPVYQRRLRMSAFHACSFDTKQDEMLITYAADSLIYVRGLDGKLKYAFGRGVEGFDYNYPQISSFDDYTEHRIEQQLEYGYYMELKVVDNLVFRSYKCPQTSGYGIQIYRGCEYVGDLHFNEHTYVFGRIGDLFYAATDADLDQDVYHIYRFRL